MIAGHRGVTENMQFPHGHPISINQELDTPSSESMLCISSLSSLTMAFGLSSRPPPRPQRSASQSKPTPAVPQALKYHPRYSHQTGDEVIFQAQDGTCFRFDWDMLVPFSGFLKGLRRTVPASAVNEPIRLAKVTARSVAFTFDIIRATLRGSFNPAFIEIESDDEFMDEVITLGELYELPIALGCLFQIKKAAGVDTTVLYTLAMLAHDTRECGSLVDTLIERGTEGIPPWTLRTLKVRNPLALVMLYEVGQLWDSFRNVSGPFHALFVQYEFSQSFCGLLCATSALNSDFNVLAASVFLNLMKDVAQPSELGKVDAYCLSHCKCRRCGAQISLAIKEYLRFALKDSLLAYALLLALRSLPARKRTVHFSPT